MGFSTGMGPCTAVGGAGESEGPGRNLEYQRRRHQSEKPSMSSHEGGTTDCRLRLLCTTTLVGLPPGSGGGPGPLLFQTVVSQEGELDVGWRRAKASCAPLHCCIEPTRSNHCCFASSSFQLGFWPILTQSHTGHRILRKIDPT